MKFLDQPKIWKIVITILLLIGVNYNIVNFPLFLVLMIINLILNININGSIKVE
jgi:uncharacterized membrane protein YphA (DoxX/SURF4 family)